METEDGVDAIIEECRNSIVKKLNILYDLIDHHKSRSEIDWSRAEAEARGVVERIEVIREALSGRKRD